MCIYIYIYIHIYINIIIKIIMTGGAEGEANLPKRVLPLTKRMIE